MGEIFVVLTSTTKTTKFNHHDRYMVHVYMEMIIDRSAIIIYICQPTETQIVGLEEVKRSKDGEIEKYKKYLNKAKKIIESFGGNKGQADDSMEVRFSSSS